MQARPGQRPRRAHLVRLDLGLLAPGEGGVQQLGQGHVHHVRVRVELQRVHEGQAHGLDGGVQAGRAAPGRGAQVLYLTQDVHRHQRRDALRQLWKTISIVSTGVRFIGIRNLSPQ